MVSKELENIIKETVEVYKKNPGVLDDILKTDPEAYGWIQAILMIARKMGYLR